MGVCSMQYNLKIVDYVDDIQINYYSKRIERREDYEDSTVISKNVKQSNKSNLQKCNDSLSVTWYNPKTGKIEVVPYGFQVIDKPFSNEKMLYPLDKFIDDDMYISMEFEQLYPLVLEKIKAEEEKNKFRNEMRSVRRTKHSIYSLARANEWKLFVTITFKDVDCRHNFDLAKKTLSKRIDNVKQKNKLEFKYVLIPEEDKNGNWHFHGLFKDIKGIKLNRSINPHTGKPITQNGMQIYNLPQFDTLGYNTATYVQNNAKVTRYITKYITKDMEIKFPGKRKYLSSKGLSKGNTVVFDIDDEEQIEEYIKKVYAYDLVQTHEKEVINPYNESRINYKQYKK